MVTTIDGISLLSVQFYYYSIQGKSDGLAVGAASPASPPPAAVTRTQQSVETQQSTDSGNNYSQWFTIDYCDVSHYFQ